MAAWGERLAGVRGVLLDISGVLYDGGEGGGAPIAGSVEALARLKRSQLKVRFCTNESQKSRGDLVGTLRRLGFDISEGEVTAPAPATCLILKERGLRPHLLIHDGVRSEFDQIDTSNPNCVVIGDAGEGFSYQNMNKAFQVLMELENPVLFSLGKGMQASHCCGFSRCGARAPDAQAQRPWLTGPAALRHVGSSRTGARTRVPCIGRRTLNHCTTREALTVS
ncbi:phospholysine phosphohistidine inorganic pyrophosphate phosphatase isoform X4 [Kogia breviceps]|uniref:phospholysine phosphohistidine inorganic pyrophosphate phosphatase isoform X4 n=1 Tax=Kogia breviceps TaxID=27615 RepID=UPI0034D26FCF